MLCLMLQWGLMMDQKCVNVSGTFPLDNISAGYDKNSIGLYHDNRSIFKKST